MIVSFLHFDPEIRIKADRLYREYLTPVEKYIDAFDRKWIDIVELQPQYGDEREEGRVSESNMPEGCYDNK